MVRVGIIGLGFVGEAMHHSFIQKGLSGNKLQVYDKYKYGSGVGTFDSILKTDIVFSALPTQFSYSTMSYDKAAIFETLNKLQESEYTGAIVVKSTVEPGTCDMLSARYPKLNIVHNPEFLTARTAAKDFHYQKHIVLGKASGCSTKAFGEVEKFYTTNYPLANVSKCLSTESECMKILCNDFYAIKVQIFNEFKGLTDHMDVKYSNVVELMLKNGWINPMHTNVPGPDNLPSYGGACFPKDTNATLAVMKKNNIPHMVLEATINERNKMREDNDNVI